jgi:hypothetical protein
VVLTFEEGDAFRFTPCPADEVDDLNFVCNIKEYVRSDNIEEVCTGV